MPSVPPMISKLASEMSSSWVKLLPVLGSLASIRAEKRSRCGRSFCCMRQSANERLRVMRLADPMDQLGEEHPVKVGEK